MIELKGLMLKEVQLDHQHVLVHMFFGHPNMPKSLFLPFSTFTPLLMLRGWRLCTCRLDTDFVSAPFWIPPLEGVESLQEIQTQECCAS